MNTDNTSADRRPHILVTNDDGIHSDFFQVLVEALLPQFRITIAAPCGERSWIGRAVSRNNDINVENRSSDFPSCVAAYAIGGTPTDCVNIALAHLCKDDLPDAVCSGINIGFNAGNALLYSSGTVAGALEGAFFGLPALAFSQVLNAEQFEQMRQSGGTRLPADIQQTLRHSARHAARITAEVVASQPRKSHTAPLHNINFPMPTNADTQTRHTDPLPGPMQQLFIPTDASHKRFTFCYIPTPTDTILQGNYDIPCLQRGFISHSIKVF